MGVDAHCEKVAHFFDETAPILLLLIALMQFCLILASLNLSKAAGRLILAARLAVSATCKSTRNGWREQPTRRQDPRLLVTRRSRQVPGRVITLLYRVCACVMHTCEAERAPGASVCGARRGVSMSGS